MAPGQKAARRLLEKAHLPEPWDTCFTTGDYSCHRYV
jgi:hypothetical protein